MRGARRTGLLCIALIAVLLCCRAHAGADAQAEDPGQTPAWLDDKAFASQEGEIDLGGLRDSLDLKGLLLRFGGGLALVLALVFGATLAARRLGLRGRGSPEGGLLLRVVHRVPLGPKRFLCLVDVAGTWVLLGVAENGINLLMEIEERDKDARFASALAGSQDRAEEPARPEPVPAAEAAT